MKIEQQKIHGFPCLFLFYNSYSRFPMSTYFIHWIRCFSFWIIFFQKLQLATCIEDVFPTNNIHFQRDRTIDFPATIPGGYWQLPTSLSAPESSRVLRGLAMGPKTRNHHQPDKETMWQNCLVISMVTWI